MKGRETGAVRSNHLNCFSDPIAGSVDPGGVYGVDSRRRFWLSHHTAVLLVSSVLNWDDLTIMEMGDGIAGKLRAREQHGDGVLARVLSIGSMREGRPSRDRIECDV